MFPPEALLVTAAYGHLEHALGGGDGATVPLGRRELFGGISFTNICRNSKKAQAVSHTHTHTYITA